MPRTVEGLSRIDILERSVVGTMDSGADREQIIDMFGAVRARGLMGVMEPGLPDQESKEVLDMMLTHIEGIVRDCRDLRYLPPLSQRCKRKIGGSSRADEK